MPLRNARAPPASSGGSPRAAWRRRVALSTGAGTTVREFEAGARTHGRLMRAAGGAPRGADVVELALTVPQAALVEPHGRYGAAACPPEPCGLRRTGARAESY